MSTGNMSTLPFGVPNPFYQQPEAAAPVPQTPALTIKSILDELPDGVTIYQLTLHDDKGKVISDRAPSPTYQLQPGDTIELRGNGKTWITHANSDASDIDPPTEISAPAKASNPDVRNFGTNTNPDWRQYNADSKSWDPMNVGPNGPSPKDTAANAKLVALAQGALQKAAAGKMPTQSELAAYDQVQADPALQAQLMGGITGGAGTPRSFTQTGPGGTGNVAQTPVEAAIDAATDDPRVRMAMKLGASLEGGLGAAGTHGAGDGGMSWGPFQINHNANMHADISRDDSEDPEKATQYMLGEYQDAVEKVPADMWSSNPKEAARLAAYYAERPAQMYDQGRVDSAWNGLFGGTGGAGGGGIGGFSPLTLPGSSKGLTALQQAQLAKTQQDLLPKAQLALSQQFDTLKYIQQQIAAGTISPAEATSYYAAVKAQTQAQLAGTTPYAIFKQQQDFENQQATNAKALLNTQVTASGALVDNLLNQLKPSAKVPPLVASSVPFDINSVLGVAKSNIQQYIPQELTDSAQRLLSSFYGPQAAAPGATDASGNPLNVPPPPDTTDQTDQTQPPLAA